MRNIGEKANSVKTLREDKYYMSTLNQQLTVFKKEKRKTMWIFHVIHRSAVYLRVHKAG